MKIKKQRKKVVTSTTDQDKATRLLKATQQVKEQYHPSPEETVYSRLYNHKKGV